MAVRIYEILERWKEKALSVELDNHNKCERKKQKRSQRTSNASCEDLRSRETGTNCELLERGSIHRNRERGSVCRNREGRERNRKETANLCRGKSKHEIACSHCNTNVHCVVICVLH